MSEYFQRVANDVLKASEELSMVMEDGIAAMLGGSGAKSSSGDHDTTTKPAAGEFDVDDFEVLEEELMNSPLQGMTESVLNDLMKNQVRPRKGFLDTSVFHFHD